MLCVLAYKLLCMAVVSPVWFQQCCIFFI